MSFDLQAFAEESQSDGSVVLEEGVDSSAHLTVSGRDKRFLEALAADKKLRVESLAQDGSEWSVVVRSTRYAGVVALPDSGQLYIKPKITGTALLRLLQYSEHTDIDLLDKRAHVAGGTDYVEFLAELFTDELEGVLRRGPEQAYERVTDDESYIRGRFNAHRQLQRHGPAGTEFDCTYDELTRDTELNQTVLYAGWVLENAMSPGKTQRTLHGQLVRLRRDVTLTRRTAEAARQLTLTRQTNHYESLLRLCILILESAYLEEMAPGESAAYTILLSMQDRFEEVVQKATDAVTDFETRREPVWTDFFDTNLDFSPKPDVLIRDEDGPLAVVDAKWKQYDGQPKREDIYQMIGYQTYIEGDAALVYPGAVENAGLKTTASIKHGHTLYIGTLPVVSAGSEFDEYSAQLEAAMGEIVAAVAPAEVQR